MTCNFKITALSAAILASLMTAAYVQAEEADDDVEVIEVTGFKSSLRKAMNAKRFADGVTDSIHAEDVGKSTDQNIADALSRVTGVTVQEEDGEGTRISVRGAGPNLNQISMNGVQLTSGMNGDDADQSVDLSSFSSDILASIDVQKTAAADQDEGSLGASVVLRTVKPLTLSKPKRSLEVQGRHNDYADESDYKVAGSFSDKFLDDTLGIIVTASVETQKTRRDQFTGSWYPDPIKVPAGSAVDTNGKTITSDIEAIGLNFTNQILNLNQRDRKTIAAGFQFLPTESTDIQLDISYSEQDITKDQHKVQQQILTSNSNVESDYERAVDEQWWVVDTESNTILKNLQRDGKGKVSRVVGGDNVKTTVISLSIKQDITDDLVMDLRGGFSKTSNQNKDEYGVITAPAARGIDDVPSISDPNDPTAVTLSPGGYDLTDGHPNLVFAETYTQWYPSDPGKNTEGLQPSKTNILDPYLSTISSLTSYDRRNSDIARSFYADFDWSVDFAGVTMIEFGGKYSNRTKDVYTNATSLKKSSLEVASEDSENGLDNIPLIDILKNEKFPVDNFLEGIVSNTDAAYLSGWGVADPELAFNLVSNGEGVRIQDKDSGSRRVEEEINSFYTKMNFEYLDGSLTGNVGLRYVNTKTHSLAYSSIKYQKNALDPVAMVYDMGLANTSGNRPACATGDDILYPNGDTGSQYPDLVMRDDDGNVIGTQTVDIYSDMGCYSEALIGNDDLVVDYSNGTPEIIKNDASSTRKSNLKTVKTFVDQSTNPARFVAGSGSKEIVGLDGASPEITWTGYDYVGYDADDRPFQTPGHGSSEVFLPSLNLNYAISDSMISRFAVSKTMARPKFDSTLNQLIINEALSKPNGTGSLKDPNLQPLESKNIDLSFEWYFNDSGMVSLALFHKDMSNFEETITQTYYYKDVRSDYNLGEDISNPSDLLISPGDQVPWLEYSDNTGTPYSCMPDRMYATAKEVGSALEFKCHGVDIKESRNGKGAVTKGLEFTYNQNYDFLPGFLSGLGLSVNYTFADSESEAELLQTTGESVQPLPQPYTPKHSANTTLFWEQNGLELRLAHRYNSIQLINRGTSSGAIWQDATSRLDFSASYKINDTFSLTLHALNLTDDTTRQFYTSTRTEFTAVDASGAAILDEFGAATYTSFDEGNAMDSDVYDKRTTSEYKTGRQYRIGLRATF